MTEFEDLAVWREAHGVVLSVYELTRSLPAEEAYGLVSQMRRAAVSVAANIVEGQSRAQPGDFRRFLDIALGSASELRYFLILSRDLRYLPETDVSQVHSRLCGVIRMLRAFRDTRS